MDCCLHQLVFTWWPCTMLLCFSRLGVTVVTPGHSHVTLLAPLCAASQLWLTAHSALSLPPCCTAVHTVQCCTSVHSMGRTLTFAAPDPGPSPDHPPSSLSPLSSSRPPQSSASRDLVTLYEQEPGLVTHWPLHYYRLYLGDSQHQARTIREDFHYSSTIIIRLLRSRTLITLTF